MLLLCLQVVLPGVLPTASCFHVAKGIILPFVCVCVQVLVCTVCTGVCDAFTGTSSHICFLFWQRASQPTSQVAGCLVYPQAPEQGSAAATVEASRRLREEQPEEGRNSQTAALQLVVKV